ncbi:MAG: hypothetical protein JNL82_31205 [Myxococcales bacterium]|nr:hypothetical protein [Myxococcales bacterium]
MHTFIKTTLMGVGAAAALTGCAAYKLEPPPGFALVSGGDYEMRMKAQDNVGLSVRRFDNVKGGTLAYWASDLVTKLGRRGYVLTGQAAVEAKNGREGTRFDFDYVLPGTDKAKFYTVSLFVTDKYKVVVQVAGDKEFAAAYRGRSDEILGELKVRGCKAGSKICGSPQPGKLQTPAPLVVPDGPPDVGPGDATGAAGSAAVPSAVASPAPTPAAPPP